MRSLPLVVISYILTIPTPALSANLSEINPQIIRQALALELVSCSKDICSISKENSMDIHNSSEMNDFLDFLKDSLNDPYTHIFLTEFENSTLSTQDFEWPPVVRK